MHDMLRELTSYGQFLIPLLTVSHEVEPERVQWGGKEQYFLHYAAAEKKAETVILYLHGGGWNSGEAKKFHYIGQFFAKSGYDCVLLNYRKVPKVHYDELLSDVFQGYCEVRKRFSAKQSARYIVIGSSAGAHLGALLCYDTDMQKKFRVDPRPFLGLISLAGPLCFDAPRTWAFQTLLKGLFQSKAREDWKRGEPICKLRRGQKVPVLVIQSAHDGIVGMAQAKKFCGMAQNLGIRSRLCEVESSKNTHSAYSAGIFFETPETSQTLGWVMKQIETWSKFR